MLGGPAGGVMASLLGLFACLQEGQQALQAEGGDSQTAAQAQVSSPSPQSTIKLGDVSVPVLSTQRLHELNAEAGTDQGNESQGRGSGEGELPAKDMEVSRARCCFGNFQKKRA